MKQELIDRLSAITEEEREYLADKSHFNKSKYFGAGTNIVSDRLLFPRETTKREKKQIEIRTHTRFIEFPLHGHDYIEMMYVCSGNIVHIVDGSPIVLPRGGVLLMNRHVKHSIKRAGKQDIGINFIISSVLFESVVSEIKTSNIFTEFLIENLRNNGRPVLLQFNIDGVLPIENLMDNLMHSIINNVCTESYILQKTMSLLLTYFISFDNILLNKLVTSDYNEQMKNEIMNYIKTNYRDASLTNLAERLGLSHTYLCKWIANNMDMNFKDMLLEQRFKVSEYLLKTTNLSIADIACAVGYENASYFYKQFKNRFGETPREVRHKK